MDQPPSELFDMYELTELPRSTVVAKDELGRMILSLSWYAEEAVPVVYEEFRSRPLGYADEPAEPVEVDRPNPCTCMLCGSTQPGMGLEMQALNDSNHTHSYGWAAVEVLLRGKTTTGASTIGNPDILHERCTRRACRGSMGSSAAFPRQNNHCSPVS